MGQIACQLLRVRRRRRVGEGEWRQCRDERSGITASDQALRIHVRRLRLERGLRDDFYRIDRLVAPENAQAREIRDRPNRQRLEPFELLLVVRIAIARRIARLGRRFEFDKCARRLAGALERDIWTTNAGRCEFGDDDEFVGRNQRQQGFEQSLELRRQGLFEIAGPRATPLADAPRIFDDRLYRHCATLTQIRRITRNGRQWLVTASRRGRPPRSTASSRP